LDSAVGHRFPLLARAMIFSATLPASALPQRDDAALMREIEAMVNDPMPLADRQQRIAELKREIDMLRFVEEPLVAAAIANGAYVQREPLAPAQMVLGVKVIAQQQSRRSRRGVEAFKRTCRVKARSMKIACGLAAVRTCPGFLTSFSEAPVSVAG
jgi:hypothetical protein